MVERIKNKSLKINAFLNVLKSCSNILIPVITYPYISRTLGAGNYGKYSFAESVISIFLVFASMGIPVYAVREGARIRDNQKETVKFCSEIFSINIIALVIMILLLFMISSFVPRLRQDRILIYMLSMNIITNVLSRDWINSIYEDFLYTTIKYLVFQFVSVIMLLLFVKKVDDYIIYTSIVVFSNSGGYIVNFFYTKRYIPINVTWHMNLKKHIRPILYLFGISLAVQVYIRSDIAILGFLRSNEEVGIYTLSSRIYTTVKTLLNAVVMVAIPRISNHIGEKDATLYHFILNRLHRYLYIMIFPCVTGLFFESNNIMRLIGGIEFVRGTNALRILCFAMVFAVFGCYYSQAVLVPNRLERCFFCATVISAMGNIGLNFIMIPYCGMEGAAITTVISEVVVFMICYCYSIKLYSRKKNQSTVPVFIGCLMISVVCLFINQLPIDYYIQIIMSIFISVVLYFLLLLIFWKKALK